MAAAAAHTLADEPKSAASAGTAKDFLRIVTDANKSPAALETAVVRFTPAKDAKDKLRVDLIAAVHLGEKSYYERLNQLFEKYDVVLYELVAPKGTRIPKGAVGRTDNPVSMLQTFLGRNLALQFQLEHIDYTKPNLVHADLSPDELSAAMTKRGETVWTFVARALALSMAQSGGDEGLTDAKIIAALFDRNRTLALKRVMAEQFVNMDGTMNVLEGPNGSSLIADRNSAALAVLREQIAAGRKTIAIFYGGGHMMNFQKRLVSEFHLAPRETTWLVAWDLRDRRNSTKPPALKTSPKP